MSEKKERAPFKSGINDFEAIRGRMKEIGVEHGIDLTKTPTAEEPKPYYPDVYA